VEAAPADASRAPEPMAAPHTPAINTRTKSSTVIHCEIFLMMRSSFVLIGIRNTWNETDSLSFASFHGMRAPGTGFRSTHASGFFKAAPAASSIAMTSSVAERGTGGSGLMKKSTIRLTRFLKKVP
jgi:hypothetical protein